MGDLKAAVIGLGVVGQAQVRLFGDRVGAAYDPAAGGPYPEQAIAGCDFAVICVGTPQGEDGRADLSFLDDAVGRLPGDMPVMIRSTIPPGTTHRVGRDRLAVHVPEFLNERPEGPWRESADVPFLIIGGTPDAHQFFVPLLQAVCPRPVYVCSGLEAELVKYTANAYLAAKVTFANEMARVCGAYGVPWDRVRHGWLHDPRAGDSHTRVEGAGFAGRCLPKDLSALIAASRDAGYEPGFLRAVADANARFRSARGEYEKRARESSDIAAHLPFLHDTAAGYAGPVVIELGVRTGNSTAAFLASAERAGGTVWSADIRPPLVPGWWHENPRWHFRQGDDLGPAITRWAPPECDVLFIDSDHTYEQATAELEEYGPRVRAGGVILAHDTQFLDGGDCGEPAGPVAQALTDWCEATGNTWENRPGSWGLGVIRIPR